MAWLARYDSTFEYQNNGELAARRSPVITAAPGGLIRSLLSVVR